MFLIDQNHVDFSVQQLYVLYKPAASVRARYKLIHKSKNISFPRYSKFPFLYRDSREARHLDKAQTSAMNSQICPGGYLRNFWVGMCRWDPGTLNLYQN